MKRSFRVATVFTGAAALATGLAPMAQAGTVAPGVTAATIGGDCNTAFAATASLHLYYTSSENHSLAACFTGFGTYTIGKGKRFAYYCAGEYKGHLYINGQARAFTSGYHNLYGASVSKVSISNYNNLDSVSASACVTYG